LKKSNVEPLLLVLNTVTIHTTSKNICASIHLGCCISLEMAISLKMVQLPITEVLWRKYKIILLLFFSLTLQPSAGYGLLVNEVS
jgi:hypothetical protein